MFFRFLLKEELLLRSLMRELKPNETFDRYPVITGTRERAQICVFEFVISRLPATGGSSASDFYDLHHDAVHFRLRGSDRAAEEGGSSGV